MDKIILSSQDVETLLSWRDKNADLVRRNPAPFKGILLEFPEVEKAIKAYNDAGKIAFYILEDGQKAGKITGHQLPGGFFKVKKNTTNYTSDEIQTVITVYASLMALIVYHEPAAAAARQRRQDGPKKRKSCTRRVKTGITYILTRGSAGPRIHPRGHHASPAAAFQVRGHYRRYKDGRKIWIKPYTKGNGKQKSKEYKLGKTE